MQHRLTRRAAARGETVVALMDDADADGTWDREERRTIRAAVIDVTLLIKAANAAEALGHALSRGIEDEAYRQQLIDAYWAAIDGLPSNAEAA
jgi:hypothetical protein